MFCDANFEGGICCNPGPKPRSTKDIGNHDPGRAKFCPLRPRPAGPETARTAGRSGRAGRLRPRLFLLLFFTQALRPHRSPPPSQICLENPCWGSYPTQPFKQPHSGPQGRTTGELLALPFSLYCVLVFDMPDQKPLINFIPYILHLNVDFPKSFHYNDFTERGDAADADLSSDD